MEIQQIYIVTTLHGVTYPVGQILTGESTDGKQIFAASLHYLAMQGNITNTLLFPWIGKFFQANEENETYVFQAETLPEIKNWLEQYIGKILSWPKLEEMKGSNYVWIDTKWYLAYAIEWMELRKDVYALTEVKPPTKKK